MLTFTGQRSVGELNLYADDADLFQWYYLPGNPGIAMDDRGLPILSLVVYRRDLDRLTEEERRTHLGGGLLTFTAELAATPAETDAILDAILKDPNFRTAVERGHLERLHLSTWDPNEVRKAIKLSQAPAQDGTVMVGIVGETTGSTGEFVTTLIGGGKANLVGNHRVAVTAKLTIDGAVLLQQLLEANRPGLYVRYEFTLAHRLNGVTMSVWCQADKAWSAVQTQWQSLQDNASFTDRSGSGWETHSASHDESQRAGDILTRSLTASELAGVRVIPESAVPAEQIMELEKAGMLMLSDFLSATFLQFNPGADFQPDTKPTLETELPTARGKEYGHHGIEQYSLKSWSDSMHASLNFTLTSKTVVNTVVPAEGNLANVLGDASAADVILLVDLISQFHEVLDVQVLCTTDFEHEPVDAVKVHMEYRSSSGLVAKDFVFQGDNTPQRFFAYRDGDNFEYDYVTEISYKQSSATFQSRGRSKDAIRILDTDAVGVLHVDIQCGLVDWDRVEQVLVQLAYGSGLGRKEFQTRLSKDHEKDSWVEPVGESPLKEYEYQLVFVNKEGRRIEVPSARSRARALYVNQPFQEDLTVQLVPAGSFKAAGGLLSRIDVGLRYNDAGNQYTMTGSATLTKPEDNFVWKVPLLDPKVRGYEYQVKVFYSDGVVREDAWRPSDAVILAVGDPYGVRVEIVPTLLNIPPGRFAMGTLTLRFTDPDLPQAAEKTFHIADFSKTFNWYFRVVDPARHAYTWQLTLFKQEGEQVNELVLPVQSHDKEVLVLKPPPTG